MNITQQKYLLLLKTLYNPAAGRQEKEAVGKAIHEMTETEQVEFNNFQHTVGEHFLKIMEELEQATKDLGDDFSDADPRKWDTQDWDIFYQTVQGHYYETILRLYAEGKPNVHLIWVEIEKRI